MERGAYRGVPSLEAPEERLPKRLARATDAAVGGAASSAAFVDLSLAISFVVGIFPVKVELWCPAVFGTGITDVAEVGIFDAANVLKEDGLATVGTGFQAISVIEVITVPGSYSRKGRIERNTGTGTVTAYAAAGFTNFLEATEFKV